MRCYALETVSDGEVTLDQTANLLDHQVGVLRECAQHILECLKGRQRVQKVFHKLLLLLARDAYPCLTSNAGCPSVPRRYINPEGAEGFPKGLVTELLHDGRYILLLTHAFDGQKVFQLGKQQVRCNATVPAAMLRNGYTSARNLLTNLCFHIVREEAVLPIQLLFQMRDKLLQAFFVQGLLNPNFEFGSADLRLRRHINHYDESARKTLAC